IRTAGSQLPIKRILNSIARNTAKSLDAEGAAIMLLSSKKQHLAVIAADGLSDIYLRKGALNAHKSLPQVMDGRITYFKDITKAREVQYPMATDFEKIRSVLGVPISQNGEIIGELRVYSQDQMQHGPSEKEYLSSVSSIISLVLYRHEIKPLGENSLTVTPHSPSIVKARTGPPVSSIRPESFSHPSEEQFARILDFYRVEWLYEPRSFPLLMEGNKVMEMFTPDFYLPELELYVELTTIKQSLITEKNRKIRKLRELYPEVNIRLLNKNDYLQILMKYGYASLDMDKVQEIDRVLFNHAQIQQRVRMLANKISVDYAGKKLVLVGVLKGVVCFMSDLMRSIKLPLSVDFMAVSYFGTESNQPVRITKDLDIDISGKHVLMVEDIVDTGMTLNYLLSHLWSHTPESLRVCTLLDKKVRRLASLPIYYTGFEIPDEFVVGYGLDYAGEYRNLPFIGILNPRIIQE
ncbi:MAG TPA: hypoxanthine phosphoribosyltransferase, partial [Dehalococcoidia bacterium]|nr:hypoxanthine phosphoribosyltransferase [Dehalococcoidia bacterium]